MCTTVFVLLSMTEMLPQVLGELNEHGLTTYTVPENGAAAPVNGFVALAMATATGPLVTVIVILAQLVIVGVPLLLSLSSIE
jgi:hypothetical protein